MIDKTIYIPTEKQNFIATIYLTGSKDRWQRFPAQPRISSLQAWAQSLKNVGLTGILFHNCFTTNDILSFSSYPVKFSYIEMPPQHNSGLFRFDIYNKFIQSFDKFIDGIFFTDSTDLEILKNPFIQEGYVSDKIYIGCEQKDNSCIHIDRLSEHYENHRQLVKENSQYRSHTLLNAGLVGGKIEAIAPFIKRISEECNNILPQNRGFQDMPIINYIAFTEFFGKYSFGPHVNTAFYTYEIGNKRAWFKHK